MKNKIVLLPLDERPCNREFPYALFQSETTSIVRPDLSILGDKKRPADIGAVSDFLERECADAKGAVVSLDMLLYGGLIPSRLHHETEEAVRARLDTLRRIKRNKPDLKLYGFCCIMRCPSYSSSDEEPDYYEEYGADIHTLGNLLHRRELGLLEEAEKRRIEILQKRIPAGVYRDYTDRRAFNLQVDLAVLELVREGVLDFLVFPQDDSAKYGLTAMDQKAVRDRVRSEGLEFSVYTYPGADEVAITLTARMLNVIGEVTPRVYVRYASERAGSVIPLYEDRSLGETIKYHILAAGCGFATSLAEADLVFAVSAPGTDMEEAACQPGGHAAYTIERNLTEFVLFIEDCIARGIPVTIGDNAYANGADLELIGLLNRRGLLDKVAGYAGWNTSSNTLGTALGMGVQVLACGKTAAFMDFLAERYLEDAGYCSVVRNKVTTEVLPKLGYTYFNVGEPRGEVAQAIRAELERFAQDHLSGLGNVEIEEVYQPWSRMFETGLTVKYRGIQR